MIRLTPHTVLAIVHIDFNYYGWLRIGFMFFNFPSYSGLTDSGMA